MKKEILWKITDKKEHRFTKELKESVTFWGGRKKGRFPLIYRIEHNILINQCAISPKKNKKLTIPSELHINWNDFLKVITVHDERHQEVRWQYFLVSLFIYLFNWPCSIGYATKCLLNKYFKKYRELNIPLAKWSSMQNDFQREPPA